ncbi:MAG: hypothetical protein JJE39_10045 [Vicinamibacteria bacterium]|nr:hypothetical protein [Vicinamibacteria bacterium]
MTDRSAPPIPAGVLTEEQIEAISGGGCTLQEYISALNQLRAGYDSLVDFTSYVIERVVAK